MSEHLILTLGDIRACNPYLDGWRKLLANLGYDLPEEARAISAFDGLFDPGRQVSLGDVTHSNGVVDALIFARALPDTVEARRAIVGMVLPAMKRVAQLTGDAHTHTIIVDIERWQAGDDSVDLRAAARAAWAGWAAADVERELQRADVLAASPLLAFAKEITNG